MDEQIAKITQRARAISRYLVIGGIAFLAIFVFALFARNRAPVPGDNVHVVTATDIAVYKAFLDQTNRDRDDFLFVPSGQSLNLICVNETADPTKIAGVISQEDHASPELRRSLLARNSASVPIPRFASFVSAAAPSRFGMSPKMSNCEVHFSLPAYSADGSTALVYYLVESEYALTSGVCVLKRTWWSWSVNAPLTSPGPSALNR